MLTALAIVLLLLLPIMVVHRVLIQVPIRISRKSGHGSRRSRCNYRSLRPSCALATPRHIKFNSVDQDWTPFNPASPASPISPSQRNTKGWTDRNGVEDSSKYQPSQLAEEQRTASRFHKLLARDIDTTLLIDPRLRKDAHLYMEEVIGRLQALDVGFPLPLKPNGLEKFPKVVAPSVLGPIADLAETEIPANNSNGWTDAITKDLQRTADKLQTSDIAKCVRVARNRETPNKRLAISAPVFAMVAALLSLLGCWPGIQLAGVVAACSILAVLVSSFSNGGQIGMLFELYRNCPGYYAEMEQDIQSTMRIPICQREDGEFVAPKDGLQLGCRDQTP